MHSACPSLKPRGQQLTKMERKKIMNICPTICAVTNITSCRVKSALSNEVSLISLLTNLNCTRDCLHMCLMYIFHVLFSFSVIILFYIMRERDTEKWGEHHNFNFETYLFDDALFSPYIKRFFFRGHWNRQSDWELSITKTSKIVQIVPFSNTSDQNATSETLTNIRGAQFRGIINHNAKNQKKIFEQKIEIRLEYSFELVNSFGFDWFSGTIKGALIRWFNTFRILQIIVFWHNFFHIN